MERAGAIVIGGGIAGCSAAYHLAKLGVNDVLLLEKAELTSGSTHHAAGLVTQFNPSATMMRLRRASIELYRSLGVFETVGSVRIASTADGLTELRRAASRAAGIGLEVEQISAREVAELLPGADPASVAGAIWLPDDGHVDPHIATHALADAARALGASIRLHTRVLGIELGKRGEVRAVITDSGPIETERVVNAAGIWAPRVAAMAGAFIPSVPVDHQHVAMAAVAGSEVARDAPCFRDTDNLVYGRGESGGMLVGGYEHDPVSRWSDGVPWEHGSSPVPSDMERFAPLLEGAIRRFPFLEESGVIRLLCHPDAMTPDGNPLLGPTPGVPGLWTLAGLSLNGFGGAGGLGASLAEWMTAGSSDLDVDAYRAWRFGPLYRDEVVAAESAREAYRYYYRLRYPLDELSDGRGRRLSALHSRLQEHGAVFTAKNGWERAGIIDLSSFGKIAVEGPGSLALLERVCDNRIDRPAGSVIYTQFLNARGGIVADVTVTRLEEERFRVVTGAGVLDSDLGWLRLALGERGGVALRDESAELAVIGLWGPRSREILAAVTDDDVSGEAIPYRRAAQVTIGGSAVLAQRITFVGELGFELYLAREWAVQVWDRLIAAGAAHGIRPGGYRVLDSLRIEKGYRYFGTDLTASDTPFEGGVGFCVASGKDFIGSAALAAVAAPRRRLRTLLVGGGEYLRLYGGEAVRLHGEVAGRVRSCAYAFTLGRNVALASVPADLDDRAQVAVEVLGEPVEALVAPDVLYDADNSRIRA
ncbi:MAG TPA: FAD-dependent oxidoreductase [Solirubrobacteraceae bacterium]|nr:FAD-dependent oxidoreductase [Solirubrobacteraceae bacterium]